MALWRLPPKAKVYEALSAVAGGRVKRVGENVAEVRSSSGERVYRVSWSKDMARISSDDSASYWQGYLGYPAVAVLLALGKIAYRAELARPLAGIRWQELNARFKRDYEAAVRHALAEVAAAGADAQAIEREVERIYAELAQLRLERGPRGRPPPR